MDGRDASQDGDPLREEAQRFAEHPVEELERLERVAAEGESPATPLTTTLTVAFAVGLAVVIVGGIVLAVYYTTR